MHTYKTHTHTCARIAISKIHTDTRTLAHTHTAQSAYTEALSSRLLSVVEMLTASPHDSQIGSEDKYTQKKNSNAQTRKYERDRY